jgi:hypothetical protein
MVLLMVFRPKEGAAMAAKKTTGTGSGSKKTASTGTTGKKRVGSTSVRNSPIPKSPPPAPQVKDLTDETDTSTMTTTTIRSRRQVTHEEIARRAYEIWKSGRGGTAFENWVRAERELRGQ